MNYIGFYWTLPVPWAGFTDLPKDPDAAAGMSRTIRYQVERVRRWVKENGGQLVAEEVFLELAPDRGSEQIIPVIDRLLSRARTEGARVVLVDFAAAFHWRRHGALWARLDDHRICVPLDPAPIYLDGKEFDPVRHFRGWRAAEAAHAADKPGRRAASAAAAWALREKGKTHADIAGELNARGDMTPTGRAWTAENVRKLLAGT